MDTPIDRIEKPPEKKMARCPHCHCRPCNIAMNLIAFPGETFAVVFFCGKCEKILSVAPIEPTRQPPRQESPILLPRM